VHLFHASQTGKTTTTNVSASSWGPGEVRNGGQVQTWRATANGLEIIAAQHNDLTMFLDDIGQAEPRDVSASVYMLGNQSGKMRMARGLRPARQHTWRVVYLSTGEITLAAKLAEGGLRVHAGQEVRLLNIPADAGAGLGVFEQLHGAVSAGAFADQLRLAAVTCYGTAGVAFLRRLVRDRATDPQALEQTLRDARELFLKEHLPDDADGQVRSAAMRFALIGAAGELAREYRVLPWPEGEAAGAAATCFQAWFTARGGSGAAEDQQAIDVLRLFISKHGASRFEDLDRTEEAGSAADPDAAYPGSMGGGGGKSQFAQKVIERAGYMRKLGDLREFLVLAPVWRDEIFKGMDALRAARALQKAGFLMPGKQSASSVEWIAGTGSVRVYVVRSTILG
jgi:uncharacterized protein (DUF927 family)